MVLLGPLESSGLQSPPKSASNKVLHSHECLACSYEHVFAICYKLNGVPPPHIPPELEEQLKSMFSQVQAPFEKHKPPTRQNFLSYGYTLYKFCELLGKDEYLQYFWMLKSNDKLYLQDQIWKKICKELQWEFIPTV